jgi:hypothetical protein
MSESTEIVTDVTESADAPPSSREDQFFGIRTQIGKTSKDKKLDSNQSDLEFEVVEEVVEEVAAEDSEPSNLEVSPDSELTEDELEKYGERVQKRINKLRYEQHEERRKKEAAEQMRDEAVKVAKQLTTKNKEYESLIQRGESALVGQIEERAQIFADSAKAEYRAAYEQGDTDKIIESQEKLIKAQTELNEAASRKRQLPQNNRQQAATLTPEQQQAYYQQQQAYYHQQQQAYQQSQKSQTSQTNPKAMEWWKDNSWFEDDNHKTMTGLAYGLHQEALTDKGIAPNTDEYFNFINAEMRKRFPDYEWADNTSGVRQPAASTPRHTSSVVAPSARNNGARPRKVKLQPTQRALAKRLGLTQEQYANQLLKERETSNG